MFCLTLSKKNNNKKNLKFTTVGVFIVKIKKTGY